MRFSRRGDEAGFTLVELLVAIAILGIISFALTEAFILGLRTTDATAANSSRFIAAQTLASYFTGDAQSADLVSTGTPAGCTTEPALVYRIINLSWTDQGVSGVPVSRVASYGLDPATGSDQELVRWSCTDGVTVDRKILGHLSSSPGSVDPPVSAQCDIDAADADLEPCPATGAPATITLEVRSEPPLLLTVRRRTA